MDVFGTECSYTRLYIGLVMHRLKHIRMINAAAHSEFTLAVYRYAFSYFLLTYLKTCGERSTLARLIDLLHYLSSTFTNYLPRSCHFGPMQFYPVGPGVVAVARNVSSCTGGIAGALPEL